MKRVDLAKSYLAAKVEAGACSFDVFDTFLVRRCTTPEGVFERAFQLSPAGRTHPEAATSYAQHRIDAEGRARRIKFDRSGIIEVTIEEIYARFPFRLFGLDGSALATLVQAEFAAELDLCRTNIEILRLYRQMQGRGLRTGFISDTYWGSERLARLLHSCQPDIAWDFLYASCDHGTGKSGKLFLHYLTEQGIAPAKAMHVGDNEQADIKSARHYGILPHFYPQASPPFADQLNRESSVASLLSPRLATPLDQGLRTLRRVVAARSPQSSVPSQLGMSSLGPVMCTFDAFVEARVAELRGQGGSVAVAFLGRDGFLPHRIWCEARGDTASYIEINRRVSAVGSSDTIDPIVDLIENVPKIDAKTFTEILKLDIPLVAEFLAGFPQGIATGRELAKALPALIDQNDLGALAAGLRKDILAHLRSSVPDFDRCTDLVLVDLGYSGRIQKALRRIFDYEGIATRLHGVYLLTRDDMLDDVPDGDSAVGFISDLVVTPHVKRMLLWNISPFEQLCCAPAGSVKSYENGAVRRELDPRPRQQIAAIGDAQAGALVFAKGLRDAMPEYDVSPFSDLDTAAGWTAAILGRLLLLPSDDERRLLGSFQHDVNLGTVTLAPMLDAAMMERLQIVDGLPVTCTTPPPPMWLAGCFSDVSAAHAYLYLLFGANKLPPGIFGDVKAGQIEIGLFAADGTASLRSLQVYHNGFSELRIRIPISARMQIRTIVVPIAKLATEGLIDGVFMQAGKDVQHASASRTPIEWPESQLRTAGLERSGRHFRATSADGCLIIEINPLDKPVAIINIGVTPLGADRVSSTAGGLEELPTMLEAAPNMAPAMP
jgi:FMN phosphatase YigB (HAD superfamily)